MRILHLLVSLNQGGIECWLLSLLPLIDTRKYQMDFFCLQRDRGALANDAEAHGSMVSGCSRTSSFLEYLIRLRSHLREHRYDLVHSHLGINSGLAALVARSTGTATLNTFHTSVFRYSGHPSAVVRSLGSLYANFSVALGLRCSQLTTCVGNQVLDTLDKRFSITSFACRTIDLGVEAPDLADADDRSKFRQELGFPETTPFD